MTRVLAVANQKGGVGKTTTAVSLGAALARHGKKVLLMDLDPHACASVHLRFYPDSQAVTCYDLFQAEPAQWPQLWKEIVQPCSQDQLWMAPASIRLSELEVDLKEREGKGAILKQALETIRGEYDYVVLDCPPQLGLLQINALVACDLLVIPIQTDFLALHGLKLLFDTLRMLNRVLPEPVVYRALPTMFDKRAGACRRVLELLASKMEGNMFETVIGIDTKFREASARGMVIYDIDPESRGAVSYARLAQEVLSL